MKQVQPSSPNGGWYHARYTLLNENTVDGSEIRLYNQLRLVVEIPLFTGFHTSRVVVMMMMMMMMMMFQSPSENGFMEPKYDLRFVSVMARTPLLII